MEVWLWVAIAILVIVIIILSIKINLLKKATNEIAEGFSNCLDEETNIVIDISSRDKHVRRLASTINTQLRQLRKQRQFYQQGDRELKDAITNIAHDLRTPLTAICGYLDLIEQEDKSDTLVRYISMISNRCEALKSLTEELFKYSIVASHSDLTEEDVVLNQVLEESMILFYDLMRSHGICPKIVIPEKKVKRLLNRSATFRIFENIISNAIKYSEGKLEVIMDESGKITFANEASRLTTIEVGKLFNRFFTVETGRASTGLGLSIAKILTERMGGSITADFDNQTLRIIVIFPDDSV